MESKNLFSNWIVKNILLAVVSVTLLILAISIGLNIYTRHGQTYAVPDFINMSIGDARVAAEKAGMRIEVTDSVYMKRLDRGAVYMQNPKAGSKVKAGRRILLTINAVTPKQVRMPDLVGYSMRQAKAELQSAGLVLHRLIYVDDIATNNVIRQLYRGGDIKEGRRVESGSMIDLVVGLNPEDNLTAVPDVKGLKYLRAVDAIHDNSLNIKKVYLDGNSREYADSVDASVYRQVPEASEEPLLMGSEVTIYLRK